eukprot:9188-Heterococcus_DN1.PRE.1
MKSVTSFSPDLIAIGAGCKNALALAMMATTAAALMSTMALCLCNSCASNLLKVQLQEQNFIYLRTFTLALGNMGDVADMLGVERAEPPAPLA